MEKTLLALPLVAGAIVLAGCGGSNDQSTQANAAQDAVEQAMKSATTGATRRAAAAIGPAALQVVNKTNQTVQLHVGGVNNFDWANGNRPDHIPPQGINKAVLAPGMSTLAPQLDVNTSAAGTPFNVEFIGTKPRNAVLGQIRLDVCVVGWQTDNQSNGERITGVAAGCKVGTTDYPQAGDYILRVVMPRPIAHPEYDSTEPPGVPTVLTITSKSNPTW